MNRRIANALISVFSKEHLQTLAEGLHRNGVALYSTGGTQSAIEAMGLPCTAVETVTGYPSILGGRVKTLHPKVFGGILAKRGDEHHQTDVAEHGLPFFDLVVVDLYPFEETVRTTSEESAIIEKIDIGGVSLLRAAGKNFEDVCVLSSPDEYAGFIQLLDAGNGETTRDQRRQLAVKTFDACARYDVAIANWFSGNTATETASSGTRRDLRYGENPHQKAAFHGNLDQLFDQLHGKELSYNNLVDVDAACALIAEFSEPAFAVIKHTNPCGVAVRNTVAEAWEAALAGDPESAFGGVLATNQELTAEVAEKINSIFFEVLIAPAFTPDALQVLQSKKNRILLVQKTPLNATRQQSKALLGGTLVQDADTVVAEKWEDVGGRPCTEAETADLKFANAVCKHLKSNAIALVRNGQLVGKGCGQTSRVDALRQAITKAAQSGFSLQGAVLASDAFFPFDDCVRIADESGITAFVQPGGSIRDADSIHYCKEHNLAMVLTGTRHFRH
ncbi:MAG: bifunctional phosphoribosylaminoimidazolecarboxamide formyltransferase/IMP cyclohydrolase [Sphingobacteriales bacterium]|nr:MAG: bifunctional phosphoribosylaminoimidazolecarboxamide formyltransferase/IMP cyclohydrolase [Sphingobacteriales bacterium]